MSIDLDKRFVALCARDPKLLASSFQDIKPFQLNSHYQKIYRLLQAYYVKHKRIPSIELFEQKLQENKAKIFGDNPNADDIILGLRTEIALAVETDYGFLTDEITARASRQILNSAIPKAVKLIKDEDDLDKAADVLQQAVISIKNNSTRVIVQRTNNHDYTKVLKERYQQTKDNPNTAWGIKTGFSKLDEATRGLGPGEMLVVSGRHGNGKSMWLLSACVNMFKDGKNVVLVSLEMPTEQYWGRFVACYAGLPTDAILTATLTPEQELRYFEALQEIEKKDNTFTIIDTPKTTTPNLAAELTLIHESHQPDVLGIDYLGIMKATDGRLKDHEAQAAVVEEVRELARTLKIPVVTAVQLNREPNKGKKTKGTERLSRSDNIGATADIVLQIEEVDAEQAMAKLSDRTKIFVIKNRKGKAPFEFEVRKNFACAQFENWDPTKWVAGLRS